MKDNGWKTLSSRTVYKNNWLSVREDTVIKPNGQEGIYSVVERPSSAYIIALTENQEIYLVNVFRYPTQIFSWEVPGGASSGNGADEVAKSAKRELQEETGLLARNWRLAGKFQLAKGFCDEWGYTFIATGLSQTGKHEQEEEGIVEVKIVPFKKALSMVKSGEITDGQTIAALMRASLFLENN